MQTTVFQRYAEEDLSEFSVRDIKYARARLGLLDALLEELQHSPIHQIRVRDLCRRAEVSESAFFNYYPQKDDLLFLFVRLWSIDAALFNRSTPSGLEMLRGFYNYTGRIAEQHPYLMKELLSYQARADIPGRAQFVPPLRPCEKVMVFGRVPGMENISDLGIRGLIQLGLTDAIRQGELPAMDLEQAMISVGSVFFGVAGLLASRDFQGLLEAYARSLRIVFSGLGAGS